ncbi:hypothetical protein Vadar_007649 [Vaccinium darrowii]|uniref:Uncharacterized protein n=1 Tax=Vaccinium darrowii TaxID=229202 RepID=A0ACB7YDB0_9ERIC|nr:hypothetical protein Vadar_007649 [Vaccinium darrowii]
MYSLKRIWRRRQYRRLRGANPNRKRLRIVVFGGSPRRYWRIKSIPKLRFKVASPLKLWRKFKSAYASMMVNFSARLGYLNGGDDFGGKRIAKAAGGGGPVGHHGKEEFEKRLIFEIYKSLAASKAMGTAFT